MFESLKRRNDYRKRNYENGYLGWELITDLKRYEWEKREYRTFLRRIDGAITEENVDELSFYIELLKKEVKYSAMLELYRGNSKERFMYPFHKFNDVLLNYHDPRRKAEVDLSQKCLISAPWKRSRYIHMLSHLQKEKFPYDPSNHMAIYYDTLDLACAYNGLHSLAISSYQEEGTMQASYYDTEQIFPYLTVENDLAFVYDTQKVRESLKKRKIDILPWEQELNVRVYGTDYRLLLIYTLEQNEIFHSAKVEGIKGE